jgi:hypothetical protein
MSTPSIAEPGLYESVEGIFIVRPTRDGRRLYAEKLVEIDRSGITVEYAKSAIYRLYPEDRMQPARAIELMRICRRCLVCNRKLKDLTSIERGLGPVCGKFLAK